MSSATWLPDALTCPTFASGSGSTLPSRARRLSSGCGVTSNTQRVRHDKQLQSFGSVRSWGLWVTPDARRQGGHHRIDLDAYDYRWYRVGGLEYAIERDAAPVG